MTSGNQTTASRLQDCKDRLEQAELDAERSRGLARENEELREKLALAHAQIDEAVEVDQGERRRWREQLQQAEQDVNHWTKRAMSLERTARDQSAILNEIRTMVSGKECLLPQIARLLGV